MTEAVTNFQSAPLLSKSDRKIRVVAATDTIEALYRPGSGNFLLITFNGLGRRADGRTFVAQSVAEKLDLPAIGFMSREGNWFPPEDMLILAEALKPILESYETRLTYGFSMGGYGAIKFSRLLGSTHTVAMSPQWSIHPEVAPWERRYIPYLRDRHRTMEIRTEDCAGNILLFCDPWDMDNLHAERIIAAAKRAESVQISRISMPFVGHDTWRLYLSSTVMRRIFDALITGDNRAVQRIAGQQRRIHPERATRVFWCRARQHRIAGRIAQAEAAARQAHAMPHRLPGAACHLATILIQTKRGAEAETVIREEIARYPDLHWLAVYLVNALEAQGRIRDAANELASLRERQPMQFDLAHRHATLLAKLETD